MLLITLSITTFKISISFSFLISTFSKLFEKLGFTSTTVPKKIFQTREELLEYYKSDLHKYNLKQKEAGLPAVIEEEFKARLEAALMLHLLDIRIIINC